MTMVAMLKIDWLGIRLEHFVVPVMPYRVPDRASATMRGGLQHGQAHGEVPGVLGDLRLAGLALLPQRLEPRDHHGEQLQDDAGRDVGHDPEREDRQAQQRAAAEQVDQLEQAGAAARGGVHHVQAGVDGLLRDPGGGHGGAQPEHGDDEEREQQLPAQVGRAERPHERGQHAPSSRRWVNVICRSSSGKVPSGRQRAPARRQRAPARSLACPGRSDSHARGRARAAMPGPGHAATSQLGDGTAGGGYLLPGRGGERVRAHPQPLRDRLA